MSCSHCCFACTSRGSDMTRETFRASIELAKRYGQSIMIGGGEPTLHPLLKEFVLHAMWELSFLSDEFDSPGVNIVTNGSNTGISLTLAQLAKRGVISASLSWDSYHDPIDSKVYKAFENPKSNNLDNIPSKHNDFREIRNADNSLIIPAGRAKTWGTSSYKCPCESLFITPKGDVYPCGCKKTLLTNILKNPQFIAEETINEHGYFNDCCENSPYEETRKFQSKLA